MFVTIIKLDLSGYGRIGIFMLIHMFMHHVFILIVYHMC